MDGLESGKLKRFSESFPRQLQSGMVVIIVSD